MVIHTSGTSSSLPPSLLSHSLQTLLPREGLAHESRTMLHGPTHQLAVRNAYTWVLCKCRNPEPLPQIKTTHKVVWSVYPGITRMQGKPQTDVLWHSIYTTLTSCWMCTVQSKCRDVCLFLFSLSTVMLHNMHKQYNMA